MVDTMEKRRRQAVLEKRRRQAVLEKRRRLYVLQWADFRVEMMKPRRVEQRFNIIHT
ncbi:MAG: hypothetical protein IJ249_04120 [Paludibacteraceae bacterium]|nr:hypothetical protein [Paludibacteraceae bacterium]